MLSNVPPGPVRCSTWETFKYLPISEKDRRWGLYVTGAGRLVNSTPDYDLSRHPAPYYSVWERGWVLADYAILYIIRGQGEFESEITGCLTVPAGSVIVVFPGVWHRYRPRRETPWTEYWCTFGGDYPKQLVRRGFISPSRPLLQTGLNESILHPYRCLLDRVRSQPPALQQLIAANTMEILGSALAAAEPRPQRERLASLIEKAKLVLEERTEAYVDIKKLAASVGLSYDLFRQVFKQQTGLSPYHYHLDLRISRAKELLQETPMSVREIASAIGFCHPPHFSNTFKQRVGIRPGQWRRGGQAPDQQGDRDALAHDDEL